MEIFNDTLVKYNGHDAIVTIPDGIKAIGDFAFYNCDQLEQVIFPADLRQIGNFAFYGCEQLKRLTLPATLTSLGSGAFAWCRSLTEVVVPSGLKQLNESIFYHCERLEKVLLPDGLERLGRSIFGFCQELQEIHLPASLKVIEEKAFESCGGLKQVIFPKGLKEIGAKAFYHCSMLRRMDLMGSATRIGPSALQTGATLQITCPAVFLEPVMFDDNWHLNWQYSLQKKTENYQLRDSYMPLVDLTQWKPEAQLILLCNFLETYEQYQAPQLGQYLEACQAQQKELLDFLMKTKRYAALNCALTHQIIPYQAVTPYLDSVQDREEKARIMSFGKEQEPGADAADALDDLFAALFMED